MDGDPEKSTTMVETRRLVDMSGERARNSRFCFRTRAFLVALLVLATLAGLSVILKCNTGVCQRGAELEMQLAAAIDDETSGSAEIAKEMLCNSGTNALPILLKLVQAKDSDHVFASAWKKMRRFAGRRVFSAGEYHNQALFGFHFLGNRASNAVCDLAAIYKADPSTSVRCTVIDAFGFIGPSAVQELPLIVDASMHPDPEMRASAVWASARVGQKCSEKITAVLNGGAQDPEPYVRRIAAELLGSSEESSDPSISVLIGLLKDPDSSVRGTAAWRLGQIAAKGENVVSNLVSCLNDEKNSVRFLAAEAITKIEPSNAKTKEALAILSECEDSDIRNRAKLLLSARRVRSD